MTHRYMFTSATVFAKYLKTAWLEHTMSLDTTQSVQDLQYCLHRVQFVTQNITEYKPGSVLVLVVIWIPLSDRCSNKTRSSPSLNVDM